MQKTQRTPPEQGTFEERVAKIIETPDAMKAGEILRTLLDAKVPTEQLASALHRILAAKSTVISIALITLCYLRVCGDDAVRNGAKLLLAEPYSADTDAIRSSSVIALINLPTHSTEELKLIVAHVWHRCPSIRLEVQRELRGLHREKILALIASNRPNVETGDRNAKDFENFLKFSIGAELSTATQTNEHSSKQSNNSHPNNSNLIHFHLTPQLRNSLKLLQKPNLAGESVQRLEGLITNSNDPMAVSVAFAERLLRRPAMITHTVNDKLVWLVSHPKAPRDSVSIFSSILLNTHP